MTQVSQIDPPADIRALSTLAAVDYADSFMVTGGPAGECSPEQWAQAALSQASRPVRIKLAIGWTLLGLRLGTRPARERVLGWRIRQRTPHHLLLGAGSYVGLPAELLFCRRLDGLLFATFVSQRSRLARALWPRVIPSHRRIVASLLAHGARRLDQEALTAARN